MNLLIVTFWYFLSLSRRSPLHGAAFGDHVGCIKILLDNNADPNKRDTKVSDSSRYSLNFRNYICTYPGIKFILNGCSTHKGG